MCTLYPPHYDAVSSFGIYGDLLFSSCGVTIKQWDLKERSLKQVHTLTPSHTHTHTLTDTHTRTRTHTPSHTLSHTPSHTLCTYMNNIIFTWIHDIFFLTIAA